PRTVSFSQTKPRQFRPAIDRAGFVCVRSTSCGSASSTGGLEMNDPRPSDDDAPISDDVAERILARAAELDERRDRPALTVAQLREAAIEAGISKEAFDSAVGQVISADP